MKPYAISQMPQEDGKVLKNISDIFSSVGEIQLPSVRGVEIELSCHILARACSKFFNLKYLDGRFYPNIEHSWILTENNHVIDVYPIGTLTQRLIIEPLWIDRVIANSLYIPNIFGKDQFDDENLVAKWGQDDFEDQIGTNQKWFMDSVDYLVNIFENKLN